MPEDLLDATLTGWDEVVALGEKSGFRNGQLSVLAPTGTIAFMMDCDTTGVEPDIALIKYKRLVGGGYLKIVNQTRAARAEARSATRPSQAEEIVAFIDEHETIEGAPHLKPTSTSTSSTAPSSRPTARASIHYNGHLKMMAAVQPFISPARSARRSTCRRPRPPEEIAQVYIDGWKLGLKAIAVYRDNSKRSPAAEHEEGGRRRGQGGRCDVGGPEVETVYKPLRRRLPDERASITHKFNVGGHEGYLTIGLYEDGTPGEIFLRMAKEGSTISGLMDSFATAVSLALQYGVPLKDLVNKFSHLRFEPAGLHDQPGYSDGEEPGRLHLPVHGHEVHGSQDEKDPVGIINRQLTLVGGDGGEWGARPPARCPLRAPLRRGGSARTPAQPPTDSTPTRSAERGEVQRSLMPLRHPAGSQLQQRGGQAAWRACSPVGGEETVANGLLDGLKIVAQNGEAKDRAERLAVGQAPVVFDTADSPACTDCGSIMVRNGSCYKCINCGATSGCS